MNLKNQRLCCFSWAANFAGSPAQTSSDLALRSIWMHRTPAGSGASDPGLGFPATPAQPGPTSIARDLPPSQGTVPAQSRGGRGVREEEGARNPGEESKGNL